MPTRQFPKAKGHQFYDLRAAVRAEGQPSATELWIYDVIGDDWWDPSLTAKELCQRIAAIDTDEIVLHMSSPGGSCTDGMAIFNALVSHQATVTAKIEGWTCSIATIVALAAERVEMFDNVTWMIHNPWTVAIGNAGDLREVADVLEQIEEQMSRIYMQRCTKSAEDLRAAMDAETYMQASEALDWGFVDDVVVGAAAAAAALDVDAPFLGKLRALGFRGPDGSGRTISAANEDKLRGARDAIDDVLSAVDGGAPAAPKAASGDAPRTIGIDMATLLTAAKRH
jgi:ATP-dependent Clp endopeptidase proteolytic subunit ClpP